jgi:hypothetical protein
MLYPETKDLSPPKRDLRTARITECVDLKDRV